eukprot:COSAG01_NODE_1883_length_8988_cov_67.877264_13_plen_64_part_01
MGWDKLSELGQALRSLGCHHRPQAELLRMQAGGAPPRRAAAAAARARARGGGRRRRRRPRYGRR